MMFLESLIGSIIGAITRILAGFFKNKKISGEEFSVGKASRSLVRGAVLGTVSGAVVGVATGDPAVATTVGVAVAGASDSVVKAVKSSKKGETKEERLKEIFKALYDEYIQYDHVKNSTTLNLVKKGVIKPLPEKGGLSGLINVIHPKMYKFLPDSTTAISETWRMIFNKHQKDRRFGEKLFFEALGYSVKQSDKSVINRFYSKGIIKQLFRQLVWTDIKTIEKFTRRYKITDEELYDFLMYLTEDGLEPDVKEKKKK